MSNEAIKRRLAKIEERVAPPTDIAYVQIIYRQPGDQRRDIEDFPEIAADHDPYQNRVVMVI